MNLLYIIIGFTGLISFVCFSNIQALEKLWFRPSIMEDRRNEWYRFVTHGFVHADVGHLLFNMLTLYFFGSALMDKLYTNEEFIIFYLSAIVVASIPAYIKQKNNSNYTALGASGGVSAVLCALVLYEPWGLIYIKFIIPVYYILGAVGYLIYSWYQIKHAKDNVAHDVHLWGALYGIAYMLLRHPESLSIFLREIKKVPFLT